MKRNAAICVAAAMLLSPCLSNAGEVFPVVHPEPITVRVVDGKTGKPQAGVHVVLVAGYDRRDLYLGLWREEAITDGSGEARLSNTLRNLPLLQVEVVQRGACGGDAVFSVERIRRDGLSAANRCGLAAVEASPGLLTMVVRGKIAKAIAGMEAKTTAARSANSVMSAMSRKQAVPVAELTEAEVDELRLE